MSNKQNDALNEQRQEAQGHTPGPWEVFAVMNIGEGQKKYIGGYIAGVRVDVCQIQFTSTITKEERDANASLIAAAPELLEACRIALQGLEDYGHNKEWENNLIADIRTLQAAIAKAEGK